MRSTSKLKSACALRGVAASLLACLCLLGAVAAPACAAVSGSGKGGVTAAKKSHEGASSGSLQSDAERAGEIGRKVAMSLIGLALALAAAVLAFRRDFKEAAAVLAVGLVCVLLAQEAGVKLLESTVKAITG